MADARVRGSLGLTAYRTLSGRRKPPTYTPVRDRPEGELVWIHAAEPGNNRALNDLAHRLLYMRPGCHVLLTAAHDGFGDRGVPDIWQDVMPPDHPVVTDAFVAHWKPDVAIWAWGDLLPNLILSTAESGAHMMLVDADVEGFDGRRDRWLPEVPRALLAQFNHVTARDESAHLKLAQMGRPVGAMEVAEPLHPFGKMMPVHESDLADMTATLSGRPAWLSARTSLQECTTILAAHKLALKSSHRLLLILHFSDPEDAARAEDAALAQSLLVANWSDGAFPDDNTQVLIADDDAELGLWLRVAIVTFLGGSMQAGADICDPYSVAAHGSAIVYGPNVGAYVDDFTRLMNAGAARIVNDTPSLGRAISQMIAPDHAAHMAMAGWDVVTRGADSLDRIISLTQTRLDSRMSEKR
ncbi:glycosyltransferase N-terminal domain-containing protein [Tateyamaria sp. ANG-S1]|uniref:3-deoxy-D-manno-octulosonic acid transferase n=1 Tax=Tateyamaria sp. ANG-S1 TaxID=1577905 RepID=UPI00068E3C6D|nr:glycosyltransferase N-terminal domain-containing protein [Tateyamaria sp. ANG-S1]